MRFLFEEGLKVKAQYKTAMLAGSALCAVFAERLFAGYNKVMAKIIITAGRDVVLCWFFYLFSLLP